MANLNEPLDVEAFDTMQMGLDKNMRASILVSTKRDTPAEKCMYRQLVDNNEARDKLEELLLEINDITASST